MDGAIPEPGFNSNRGHRFLRVPLLLMAMSAALLLVIAAVLLIAENRKHTLEAAGRENMNIARLVGFHTSYVLDSSVLLLGSIAQTVKSRGFAYFRSEEGKRFLLNRTQDYPDLQSMLLIDKAGELLVGATLPFPPPSVNYSDRDYFLQHQAGDDLVFGEQLMSRTQGRRGTTISQAIRSNQGALEGIVLVTIESTHFNQLFESVRGSGNEEITIFREDGAIFARFPETGVGQRFPHASVLEQVKQARSGVYEAVSVFDARHRLIAYEKIGDFPLIVVASQPRDEVLSSWWAFSAFIGAALLLAFGWLGAAGRYAFRAISQNEVLQFQLARLAQTDSLTDLANRRSFMELAGKELSRTLRYGGALSLLMIDVDFFKKINDVHGHACGDRVLQQLSELFRLELRNIDVVGRLGGEEFSVVLAQTDRVQAMEVAERLRQTIAEYCMELADGTTLRFTVSIGVASLFGTETSVEGLLSQADRALYEAKRDGRNNVKASWCLEQEYCLPAS